MQEQPPTQATRAAAEAAKSDTPSSKNNTDKSTSANQENQSGASNELISEEAGRSLAFAAANRTAPLNNDNQEFDDTNEEEQYEGEDEAVADENSEEEPGLRRRASLIASLVPDNKRLAALLAGKGPITSELRKLAKSSGLSKALVERARRRTRASAKPSVKAAAAAQKQSNASASASEKKQKHATSPTAKSMQTRQGLATTMASGSSSQLDGGPQAHLLNAVNLSHLTRNNHLKQQLNAMSASGGGAGTLPQLSSAIQRLISLGKFGIAGGGVPASAQQQHQQMLLAHLNDKRNNQTMTSTLLSNTGNNGGGHQTKQSYHTDHGDFSLTSASDGADSASSSSSSTGVGRFHSHSAADDFDSELPFELASGSALPGEQQVPHSELDETDEIGANQQQQQQPARLAELMSRWRAQMVAGGGPPEVTSATHDGGLLGLQAAQQRNKLASASHSLLDLPAASGDVATASKQQQQQLIPVEIIGLDPSVTNSILYGSMQRPPHQQPQLQARRPPLQQQQLQPLLSATSQQDHYQQAHAAPSGGDYAHHQQPNGDQAASELDIHAPGEQHDSIYTNVIASDRGQKVLDPDSGGQDGSTSQGNNSGPPPTIAGPGHTSKQSPVLHVHHFHHTSNEPAGQQQEKTEVGGGAQQQDQNGQQDPAGQQQVVVSGTATGGTGQTPEIGVVATAGESESVEEAQAPQEASGEPSPSPHDARSQPKARMRFVSSASLKGRQRPQAQVYPEGRPPRLARPQPSLYSSNNNESDDEQEQAQPNYDQSDAGPTNSNLLMVSYKPAGPAHQLSYQQQMYTDRYEPSPNPTASYPTDGSFNPSFQRPPPPYNEGSESKYSSSAGGTRVSAPSNLSQSFYNNNNGTAALQAANLLRSLMRQQQQVRQQRFQIKLAGPNEAGQWSSEDERLLNQFNLANSNQQDFNHQHYQRLPLMMASSGALSANLTSGRPTQQNPFQNNYQQFVENLAMLNQLKAAQQRPANSPGSMRSMSLSQADNLPLGGANITGELAHSTGISTLEPAHFALANTTTNSRYELASASDRFASKLRATNTSANQQQRPRTQSLFTANDNFYVPNTSTSNKSSLDQLLTQTKQQQQPPTIQSIDTQVVQPTKTLPSSGQDRVHAASGEATNFMDSTNGLSNLALAFIFVVSLLTFILIAASLIYRRRRGRVRYGGASLASNRSGGGAGSHLAGGPAHYKSTDTTIGRSGAGTRLNLTRAKHMMRSSFVGAGRGGNENITDATDLSNGSSLKSISHLGEGAAANKSHPLAGNAMQTQNGNTVQQRQLKSVLKQPSQQKQQDLNNSSQHNYINKYICANANQQQQQQSGPSKASRFFGFGFSSGDKYQSADESTTAQDRDATLTSNPDSDIKTLNTRARANYLHGQHQPLAASSKHPMSHKRVVANHTIQRGGASGAKYKNLPPIGQQGPLAPPSEACLKHAML